MTAYKFLTNKIFIYLTISTA